MKRILVTAAGGAPAINFVRSLNKGSDKYFTLGVDCNQYTVHRAITNELCLGPRANDSEYIPYLNWLIEKHDIDFIHSQPDIEVGVISENRDKLKCKTFLPSKQTVRTLRDKFLSYEAWKQADVRVPETILIRNKDDLKIAFDKFGDDIWIREIEGAAGKGSLASPTFEQAYDQIDGSSAWGITTAAERLTKDTVTWMSIFKDGKLIVAQSRERLYWEAGNRTQSGVTGITGTGRTIADPLVNDMAMRAILAVDSNPNGIFSVDMTYDKHGIPAATEINIGKFFTTHQFFTDAGLNFPEIFLKLAFDEEVNYSGEMNPLPVGLNWIRGMDTEPRLVKDEVILKLVSDFQRDIKLIDK